MKRKKILVVDDSPTVRSQIRAAIEGELDCIEAEDGVQGLARAIADNPDAAVIDVQMPQMGGVELLQQLKADSRTQSIPVVVVTTSTEVEQMNKCRALGCAGFVLKPVDAGYLKAKLRQLLKH